MKSMEEKLRSEQCRRILDALKSGAKEPQELVKLTNLSSGLVLKHTTVLMEAGFVVRIGQKFQATS